MAAIELKNGGLVGTCSADGFVTFDKADMDAHFDYVARLEAALREIHAGAKSQGAHVGMSWSQVERICSAALANQK